MIFMQYKGLFDDSRDGKTSTEDLYQTIFEHSPIGIEIYDEEGLLVDANKKCLEIFGVADILSVKSFKLFDDPNVSAENRTTLKKGCSIHYEALFDFDLVRSKNLYSTSKFGKIHLSVIIEPVKKPASNAVGFVVLVQDISERKQAEDALRESDARYRLMAEHAADVIWVLDVASQRFKFVSPSIKKLRGYTPEETMGQSAGEALTPDSQRQVNELLATRIPQFLAVAPTPLSFVDEVDQPCKDGSIVHTEATTTYLLNAQGQIELVGISRDITERKRANEALQKSEEKFSKAFKASPEAITIASMENGRYVEVNDAFLKKAGFKRDEVIGHTSIELGFWVDSNDRHRYVEELSKNGSVRNFEIQFRMRSGEVRDFLVSGEIIEIGRTQCSLNFNLDITERKRSEEALRESEKRFRKIIEQAPIAMAIIGMNGVIEFINKKATTAFGYTLEDIPSLDKWWSQAYPDRGAPEKLSADWMVRVQKALAEGREISGGEYQVTCKDGTIKTVITSGVPVFDKIFIIFNDITELKKAEADRLRLEQQIQQNQKLESLGVLAGGIAHDFNNLLGGIFGYLTVARKWVETGSEADGYLTKALGVFDRARDLTERMLTFAKGGVPAKKVIKLESIINDTISLSLGGTGITRVVNIAEDLWPVEADAGQMGQVFTNILINARQAASRNGNVSIVAKNRALDCSSLLPVCAGRYVEISIADNGPGISEENLSKIFDPFFTTKPKGMGLGLATCHSIAKAHGGYISVESQPGKGTTFKVYIPATDKSVPQVADALPSADAVAGGKVLLMDDEAFLREIGAEILVAAGFEAVTVENGEQTIEFYQQAMATGKKFDIVILDLTIVNGMGGTETLARLLEIDPGVKALVCSGYSDDPVMAEPAKYGFSGALRKPYGSDQLLQAISARVASPLQNPS
jgi:two-component system, cell cycle sensor histidine kinase and response regulator CckA